MTVTLDQATLRIARHTAGARYDDISKEATQHALLSFVNFVGCAVGGSQHEAVGIVEGALGSASELGYCTVIGRPARRNAQLAALLNGISSSVYAFDDTHAEAIVHATSPVGSGLLAAADVAPAPTAGSDFLLAFALGMEVAFRLSKAISVPPARAEVGWSLSGITGSIGAAAACGKLMNLGVDGIASAMGIAGSLAAGLRAAHGTMTMHLVPAQAGSSGVQAALLAQAGFIGPSDVLESRHGFLRLYAHEVDADALVGALETRHEVLANTFKPYPCGIVINPVVDACLQLRSGRVLHPEAIRQVELLVNTATSTLANRPHPRTDLEAQVSVQHWACAALVQGAAGITQGSPEALCEPAIVALRNRCIVTAVPGLASDAAVVRLILDDGQVLECRIEHCRGSIANPLGEDDISRKFLDQAAPVLGRKEAEALLKKCWSLPGLNDMRTIWRA